MSNQKTNNQILNNILKKNNTSNIKKNNNSDNNSNKSNNNSNKSNNNSNNSNNSNIKNETNNTNKNVSNKNVSNNNEKNANKTNNADKTNNANKTNNADKTNNANKINNANSNASTNNKNTTNNVNTNDKNNKNASSNANNKNTTNNANANVNTNSNNKNNKNEVNNDVDKNNKNNKNKSVATSVFENISNSVSNTINTLTSNNKRNNMVVKDDTNFMYIVNVILVLILCVVLFYVIRYFINRYQNYYVSSPYLLNGTKNGKHANVVSQDPNSVNYIPMKRSDNRDGVEFTYDFWILIESYEYKTGEWKHVFHKGNSTSMPNRAPGVYLHPNKNSMRVYMNTLNNPFEYVDIDNLPLRKWLHMSVVLKNKDLNIYVNNHLKTTKKLDSLPRQNQGDFWMNINGGFEGYLSNVRYYSYAISFDEIDANVRKGPNSDSCVDTNEIPPYFDDDWWHS